jgi:hypothetical protein
METEGSLPLSQVLATCPYLKPDQSSPRPYPTSWKNIVILFSIYAWVFQVASFTQLSPPKPCMHLSYPPYVLHAPPISFFLIWSLE